MFARRSDAFNQPQIAISGAAGIFWPSARTTILPLRSMARPVRCINIPTHQRVFVTNIGHTRSGIAVEALCLDCEKYQTTLYERLGDVDREALYEWLDEQEGVLDEQEGVLDEPTLTTCADSGNTTGHTDCSPNTHHSLQVIETTCETEQTWRA